MIKYIPYSFTLIIFKERSSQVKSNVINFLIIFSSFSCKQTKKKTGMGRLKFSQFKDLMFSLKSWQSTFKNHTKEKTGILKAERLRDCLGDVGKSIQLRFDLVEIFISGLISFNKFLNHEFLNVKKFNQKNINYINFYYTFFIGFQLNNEIMSVVVLRFMRKDGTLRFGDFVAAILHLTVAFCK